MDNTLSITKTNNTGYIVLLCGFVLLVWFLLPVLSIVLLLAILYHFSINKKLETFVFLLIAISLALIGYTTKSVGVRDSDIARYSESYKSISALKDFKGYAVGFLLWGNDNPFFYSLTFSFTRLFPKNPQVLPLFWGTVTYFFSFLTIRQCVHYFSPESRKSYILVMIFSCIGIITFFTVFELLKQVSSVSVFGYAVMLKISKQKHAFKFLVLSILLHFSSLFLLPAYFFASSKKALRYMPILFVFAFALSFFNFNELLGRIVSLFIHSGDLYNRIQHYTNYESWSLSLRYYADFAMYFLIIIFLYWDFFLEKDEALINKKRPFLIIHSIAFFILLINRNNVHNFIRYVTGYFPFYIMAVIYLFNVRIARNERVLLVLAVLSFYIYSNFKLLSVETVPGADYANSYMNNDVVKILSSNIVQFLQYRVNR